MVPATINLKVKWNKTSGYLTMNRLIKYLIPVFFVTLLACETEEKSGQTAQRLKAGFVNPPMEAHPGVYWYFMDGNMSKKEITKDLESMKAAGISHVLFLEVNVGVPRGKVDFLSEEWLNHFKHLVDESRRLEISITLGVGPGWTGSGGPWVKADSSMRHLVASETSVTGGKRIKMPLAVPPPHEPFFGQGWFTAELKERWLNYYDDVMVLAFPSPPIEERIDLLTEKSLVYRSPYTSDKRTKPHLPEPPSDNLLGIDPNQILDISPHLNQEGLLDWDAPEGTWTILRFVSRNNGAVTRPAPLPGVGFEADKFDTAAFNHHLDNFTAKIFDKIKPLDHEGKGGLKVLHQDSWEMGAQNWTHNFRKEFEKRRGYDPTPFFPVYQGFIVDSKEKSERFLWDLRVTGQDLVVENHVEHIKRVAHRNGLKFSIEPYDMNPTNDLVLGAVGDIPMAEFWTDLFNASFAVIEATSIANVYGHSLVPAESFTSGPDEKLDQHPASVKDRGDWAFAQGINRFVYHTFAHKPLGDHLRPGMTMGPYGVHWDRGQTWWPMVKSYHTYVSRVSYLLQQGRTVADILFLTPEGVPHIFLPPPSALQGGGFLPDRKGFDFDGVAPHKLIADADVVEGKITFPSGANYEIMVLPILETMTPQLLQKVEELLSKGATIVGPAPQRSPSLSNFPEADRKIKALAQKMWQPDTPTIITKVEYGEGKLYFGGNLNDKDGDSLYPDYGLLTDILKEKGIKENFIADTTLRYIHKKLPDLDMYFISNKTDRSLNVDSKFRISGKYPQLWDPVTGKIRNLPHYEETAGHTSIALQFAPHQSYFIIFSDRPSYIADGNYNFLKTVEETPLNKPWQVSFDPDWGGPKEITFGQLTDWKLHQHEGIKYYSGIAEYTTDLNYEKSPEDEPGERLFISLGAIKVIAEVELNGQKVGTVWSKPWELEVTSYLQPGKNTLKINVANQWANRLIGDEFLPHDGIKYEEGKFVDGINDVKWPDWLVNNEKRPSERYTFITYPFFTKESPLRSSGLLGPVKLVRKIED